MDEYRKLIMDLKYYRGVRQRANKLIVKTEKKLGAFETKWL